MGGGDILGYGERKKGAKRNEIKIKIKINPVITPATSICCAHEA